jgi:cysteinyl-tRNA synthetase
MKLHNTLTRQVETFTPIDTGKVGIYSCGPTVYDNVHIGNLRSFIFADTLRRALSQNGYHVIHTMNLTDVDDKTIRRSQELYPKLEPAEALKKLTAKYTDGFLADSRAVGNDTNALGFVKATDTIEAMQHLITKLHRQGFAYAADDGVYFSIAAYKKSGKTYGQLTEITDSSTSDARIQNDEYDKASVHDFALWKKQKAGEPAWSFELDGQKLDGRPGWHIECSAMSTANLGQPFDIHTGGVDLIFPHHENEIAQSTAGETSSVYANYFLHNEHLLVDGQKMSKSLNNFYSLKDIQSHDFEPLAFRLLILQSHYRSQAHFSWENLAAAQNRLYDLRAMAALRWQAKPTVDDAGTFALEDVPLELQGFLADDLNSPQALAYLSNISTQIQTVLLQKSMVDHFEKMLQGIDALLGLDLMGVPDITGEQKQLIADREAARAKQDWAKADQLRQQLADKAILVRDTSQGAIWARQ